MAMKSLADLDPDRIMVRMPNWVGDVTMATAALRCIRESFPKAYIAAAVRAWLGEILEGSPRIDELILCAPGGGPAGLESVVAQLRRRRFDVAFVLPHSLRTAWEVALAGVRRRVGYNRGDRGWFLTDSLRPPREGCRWRPVPKTDLYLDLCKAAGITCSSTRTELFTCPGDRRAADDMLRAASIGPSDRLVLINPGASFGSSKCWVPERFASVADELAAKYDAQVGLVCGPGEEPIVERVLNVARSSPANLARTHLPLRHLKALVERCDLLVTNCTGPRHFAVAFDKPVVVIMGSPDPRHTACNLEKTVVMRKDVPCGPCRHRVCPTDHACMNEISAEDVMAGADRLTQEHWK